MTIDPLQLRAADNAHVWHPFTAMSDYRQENAPVIVEANGFYLTDAEGRTYLDGHSSLWCNLHGHRVPAIDDAIRNQLQRVAHSTLLGLSNEPSIDLAVELVKRVPAGLSKIFYADCGAAGVEVALKIAYQYYQQRASRPEVRDKFIYFDGAYHGDTIGTMSIGAISRFKNLYSPLLFPAVWSKIPKTNFNVHAQSQDDLDERCDELATILEQHRGSIAGIVVEPLVQAAAGIQVAADGFLRRVRELATRHDVLLIADEIAVGFGRTGTMFACQQEKVSPDLLILSKGLTGGYLPLAATLTTDEVDNAFLAEPWEGKTFYHGHTYTGNPLACAAALASIRLIDRNHVLQNVQRLTSVISDELHELRSHAAVFEVRQKGVMIGIELTDAGKPFAPERRMGHQVTLACRRRGVILRNIGDVIVLMPAPAMPVADAKKLCQIVKAAINEVTTAG